jgi:AcrR family transcriptional regulator
MGLAERKAREKVIQKQKRRAEIMDAAKILFRIKGFSVTTMEDIAREAELSPAALYLYFKNKDEIYGSLSLRMMGYLIENLEHIYEDGLNAEQNLKRLKEAFYRVYEFDPYVLLNLFNLQASGKFKNVSPEFLAELNRLSVRAFGSIRKFFEAGIRDGLFRSNSPAALSDTAWSIFTGLVIWEESKKMFNPEKDYLKSTLDLAFKVFSAGLKKTKRGDQSNVRNC